MYIHQQKDWPQFTWDAELITKILGSVRHRQGQILGQMQALGFRIQEETMLKALTMDVMKSSEIEGELLNPEQIRSSIARRLGIEIAGVLPAERDVEGIVELMLDATQNNNKILSEERLFGWHSALFPSGRSGMHRIEVGKWRSGPMQVVSGGMGREKVHYEAPNAEKLASEMNLFIDWFNEEEKLEAILKAAVAHLWFVTIHPFDDGNGRIARAITDMQLSKADGVNQRFYSMSTEINKQKKGYYTILEHTQKGDLDITDWIVWFLECLKKSLLSSSVIVDKVVWKHQFWARNAGKISNERQQKMLNKLMDNFEGNLTSSKWAKMMKTSPDTALRDITDLLNKGILLKADSGGRSTHYVLNTN